MFVCEARFPFLNEMVDAELQACAGGLSTFLLCNHEHAASFSSLAQLSLSHESIIGVLRQRDIALPTYRKVKIKY